MTSDDPDGETARGAGRKPDPDILRIAEALGRKAAREDHARAMEAERLRVAPPATTER
jgi:hypothetical protein